MAFGWPSDVVQESGATPAVRVGVARAATVVVGAVPFYRRSARSRIFAAPSSAPRRGQACGPPSVDTDGSVGVRPEMPSWTRESPVQYTTETVENL